MARIVIIDPIGCHSGMKYYYNSFKGLFIKDTDVTFEILSNYNEEGLSPFFSDFFVGNTIIRVIKVLWIGIKLLFKTLFDRMPTYIYLSYGTVIDAFFLTCTIFAKNRIIDCHEVILQGSESNRFYNWLFKHIYKHCHKVIIHSEHGKDMLQKVHYTGDCFQVPHFRYIESNSYNGDNIDQDVFNCINDTSVNLLFFGNITYNKGVDLLIEAANRLSTEIKKQIRVIIAGRAVDDTIYRYTHITEGSDMYKVIIRHLNDDEMKYLYVKSDFVALPYRITYQSGVLEMAFNFRKPIIASPIPYFNATIDKYPSFGIIADFSDSSFQNTIEYLLTCKPSSFFRDNDLFNYYHQDSMAHFHDWLMSYL